MASTDVSPAVATLQSFAPVAAMDDFFNFDTFDSGPGEASSRSSSHSPSSTSYGLPPTPTLDTVPEAQEDETYLGLFNSAAKTEELYTMYDAPFDTSMSTQEFFGLRPDATTTLPAPLQTAISPSFFAIDPALTGSSSSPSDKGVVVGSSHSPSEDADVEEDEDDEDGDEDDMLRGMIRGGKGRSRKGTVVSGGIRKPTGVVMTQAVRREGEPADDEDWRPTAEEYKKMTSKEKRQLRNKISARNFRVRRKEYITTLEGDIAQRDNLIEAIRNELGSTRMENQTLRQEVDMLKKVLMKSGIKPDLPPPAPLPHDPPAAALANKENQRARGTPLPKANPNKDISSSPRIQKPFWGGKGVSGITPVHTTLVPDFAPLVSEKLAERAKVPLQENMNPGLNANPFLNSGNPAEQNKAAFDAFPDMNGFNFRSMDSYRFHLWNSMAQRASQHQMQAQTPEGLAGMLRPLYLSSPVKGAAKDGSKFTEPTAQQAMLASVVSGTFVSKLGSAFWDAFSSPNAAASRNWDSEKMRKVIEGKAVVRVVDVPSKPEGVDALEQSMKNLAIGKQGGTLPNPAIERVTSREPCFLQGLRSGTSPLSGKKTSL